jgi:hypothetical protein
MNKWFRWMGMGSLLLAPLAIVGCGSGSGSPAGVTPVVDAQNTSAAAVESLRVAAVNSLGEDLLSFGSNTAITLQARVRQSRATGGTYISALGLYYVVNSLTLTGGTIGFYSDSGLTQPAGTASVSVSPTLAIFPLTAAIVFQNVKTSAGTINGTAAVTVNNSQGSSGTIRFTNLSDGQGDVINGSLTKNADGSGSGTLTVTTGGVSYTATVTVATGGSITEQVSFGGALSAYSATEVVSSSDVTTGELMANGQELYSFQVNADGSGWITNTSTHQTQNFTSVPTALSV